MACLVVFQRRHADAYSKARARMLVVRIRIGTVPAVHGLWPEVYSSVSAYRSKWQLRGPSVHGVRKYHVDAMHCSDLKRSNEQDLLPHTGHIYKCKLQGNQQKKVWYEAEASRCSATDCILDLWLSDRLRFQCKCRHDSLPGRSTVLVSTYSRQETTILWLTNLVSSQLKSHKPTTGSNYSNTNVTLPDTDGPNTRLL